MSRSPDRATGATRDAANVAAAAVVVYAVLWFLSTQVATVRAISPFADDPWDAFASYAAIFLPVVAGATWIRSVRHRDAVLPNATARRIRWGSGLAAAIVLVAAAVDVEAILAVGFPVATASTADAGGVAPVLLGGLAAVAVVLAVLALVLDVRAATLRPGSVTFNTAEPDIVDDLLALATDAASAVGIRRPVQRLAGAVEAFLETSTISPRRHRWVFGAVIAIAAGVAFDLWHAIREGPWIDPTVALLFGTLVAAGVLAVYLGTVIPLRLLRPPG